MYVLNGLCFLNYHGTSIPHAYHCRFHKGQSMVTEYIIFLNVLYFSNEYLKTGGNWHLNETFKTGTQCITTLKAFISFPNLAICSAHLNLPGFICEAFATLHSHPFSVQILASGPCFKLPLQHNRPWRVLTAL